MATTLSLPSCVEFGFYNDEEIKRLSVCKITEDTTFDSLGHATPNGLYDARLGPTDFDQGLCTTCGNNFSTCPGHAGHIELKLPVYHPLLFPNLHKLLNTQCFACHRFRLKDALEGEEFRVRMELLNAGLLQESKELALALMSSNKEETVESNFTRREEILLRFEKLAFEAQVKRSHVLPATTHFRTARREAISDLTRTCQSNAKCGLCGTPKVKIRKAGNAKLFQSFKDSTKEEFFPCTKVLNEMKKLWKNADRELAKLYFGPDYHQFFLRSLFVPPSRFRPARRTDSGLILENAQTKLFANVLTAQNLLTARYETQQKEMEDVSMSEAEDEDDLAERLQQTMRDWTNLQDRVNVLMDDAKAENPVRNSADVLPGIRQLLEKKEGLFRQNLMGKRVNFACRSVISPDPMIGTDEIGVPLKFAKILTYPEPVTVFNVKELAQLVRNGADVHPGACFLEDSAGRLIDLKRRNRMQREELATRLEELTMETSREERTLKSQKEQRGDAATEASVFNRIRTVARASAHQFGFQTKVWRHLRNGDVMLANRQPTLHKSSIMAHRARVIDNIKMQTIRLHYANCYTYNADFDGDEINLHFPQNELARSEGYNIAYTNHQYCAPTDGVPMRGLIQDHLTMGVLLSKKDVFFTQEEVCQIVYSATSSVFSPMVLPPPAVRTRNKALWTGKQIISLVLRRVVPESTSFCLFNAKSKTPANAFQVFPQAPPAGEEAWAFDGPLSETKVAFLNGEMTHGILDKNAFGNSSKYGFVHCVFEAFGPQAAGDLLSALGRLFVHMERMWGHTCSMDDLCLNADAETERTQLILDGEALGVAKAFSFTRDGDDVQVTDVEAVRCALSDKIALSLNSKLEEARLDGQMQSVTSKIQSSVMKACVPFGQRKRFPVNNFALMVLTGAKGSLVNQSQISCMLGQQSLEGRRVPRTSVGKTLPCFDPFDPSPRAGGFVTNRFLSGIRPQEYYFHCMAGREGLLDTAVKTARSGYLQRCMVKHLEHLRVEYDRTVRADDGSIVQFIYGDDGMDAMNVPFCNGSEETLRFLHDNQTSFPVPGNLHEFGLEERYRPVMGDPLLSTENVDIQFGVLPEALEDKMNAYMDKNAGVEEEFKRIVQFKYLKSLVNPGEPVGILAAQGIGEPSTQMTLNTFHLAGHGTTNVTLGIPRLRELLWARAPGKTPTLRLECQNMEQAKHVSSRLTRVVLSDLTLCEGGGVVIREVMVRKSSDGSEMTGRDFSKRQGAASGVGTWFRRYHIQYHLQALDLIKEEFNLGMERIGESISKRLVNKLILLIGKEFKRLTGVVMKSASTTSGKSKKGGEDDEDDNEEAPEEEEVVEDEEKERRSDKSDDEDEDDDVKKKKHKASKTKKKKKRAGEEEDDDNEDEDDDASENEDEDDVEAKVEEEEEDSPEPSTTTTTSSKTTVPGLDKIPCHSQASCLLYVATSSSNSKKPFVEICLEFPADSRRILLVDICDQLARECAVRSVEGIEEAISLETDDGKFVVDVSGSSSNKFNLKTMWKYEHKHGKLSSNDVNAVLKTLGVEAARQCLIQQFQAVFDPYGIDIDERHLSLVADHMLFEGNFKAMNRHGIQFSTSPFVRITFETAVKCVVEACLLEDQELLQTPSSRVTTGQVIRAGTGAFGLVVKPIQERRSKSAV